MLMVGFLVTELKTIPAIFSFLVPIKRSHLLKAIMDMAIPLSLSDSIQISTGNKKKKISTLVKPLPSDVLLAF